MTDTLSVYLDEKLQQLAEAMVHELKPQVLHYAQKIAEKRECLLIEQIDVDIALAQLGLAIIQETEERIENAEKEPDLS